MSPFDQFQRAPAPAPAAQQPPQRLPAPAPAPTQRPVTRLPAPAVTIDPAEQRRLDLAGNADARAAESNAIAAQNAALTAGRYAADMEDRERRLARGPAAEATGEERTAAFLATRIAGGLRDLSTLRDTGPEIDAAIGGAIFGDTARNLLNSEDRQRIESAQRDILDAALTLGTGAAYTAEQLDGYRQSYFPQIGDTPQTIADKRARLMRVLEAARVKAGAAAPAIEQALAAWERAANVGGGSGGGDRDAPPGVVIESVDPVTGDASGYRINDDGTQTPWGRVGSGPDVSDLEQRAQQEGLRSQGGGGVLQTIDAGMRGAADMATLGFSDEIAAAGDTLFNGGTMDDNLAYQRYVDSRDSQNNPYARIAGQVAGGLALPYGRMGTTARAGAIEGAGYGAAYGFGSGEGSLGDRAGSAVIGAGIGGTAGAGVNALMPYAQRGAQRVAGAFNARRGNALADFDREVVEAGARQNIPIRQPDARPSTRADYGAAEASEGGNAIVQRAIAEDTAAIQRRLREVGGDGQPLTGDNYALGELAQNATNRASNDLKTRAGRLYDRVDALAPDARVAPTQTTQAINEAIASLQSSGTNATSAEVNVLRGLAEDLQQTGLTVRSLQAQRRRARNLLQSAGADPDVADAMLMDIMATAGRELEQGLASNPQALSALQQANQLWTERAILKREIGRLFVGTRNQPVAPETAAARLNQLLSPRGNSNRAIGLLREMEPAERADLRATIVENILNTRSGEAGFGAISTNIRNLNPRVMREIFGEDGIAALRDIQAITKAKADGLSRVNRSNTGVVTERNDGTFRTIMLTALGGGAGGIPGAVATGLGGKAISNWNSRRMARLLTNPDFTRLLRQAPATTNARVINRYFQRMDAIAARSPVMAADVQALQEFLRQSFTQSPMRAAAQGEPEQDGRQIPPQ